MKKILIMKGYSGKDSLCAPQTRIESFLNVVKTLGSKEE